MSNVTVEVIGAGGAGANIIHDLYGAFSLPNVSTSIIDTSMSNIVNDKIPHSIINGMGSGKVRKSNANKAYEHISTMYESKDVPDLTIIVFSAASGSGSVIAPLLMRELMVNQEKRVILIPINDTSDGLGSRNCLGTWSTLESMAEDYDLYIPTYPLTNDGTSREQTNKTACIKIKQIVKLMTGDVLEIDYSDRINWLNPLVTSESTSPGLFHIITFEGTRDDKLPGLIPVDTSGVCDSAMVISNDPALRSPRLSYDNDENRSVEAEVMYTGYFREKQESSGFLTGMIGYPVGDETVKPIDDKIKRFKTVQREKTKLSFKSQTATKDPTGLKF